MRRAAHALSLLLHPVWMPTLTIALCFRLDPRLTLYFSPAGTWLLLGTVFVMTALFPLTSAWTMLRSGIISSLDMPTRSERLPATFMALIYFVLCYYLMWRVPNDPLTMAVLFGSLLALLLTMLITLRWKISMHMVGAGGVIGALIALLVVHGAPVELALAIAFVLAGLIGTARLLDSDHTPLQVFAGGLLGGVCVFGCAWKGLFI